jgi:hypothetical protein
MKATQATTATILAAEQDARPVYDEPKKSGLGYIAGGIALLVVGLGGAYFAYTRYLVEVTPAPLAPAGVVAPIFVDDKQEIAGTGFELLQALEEELRRPVAPGSIRFLYLPASTPPVSVFSALQLPAPPILLRNLNQTPGMAGIVNLNGAQSLFFILSAASYTDTFAGMLAWEPSIARDLERLLPPDPTIGTSTPKGAAFVDEIVNNHDVRVYRDGAGRAELVYGYWDQSTLIIARDREAFSEVVNRLATSRKTGQ